MNRKSKNLIGSDVVGVARRERVNVDLHAGKTYKTIAAWLVTELPGTWASAHSAEMTVHRWFKSEFTHWG